MNKEIKKAIVFVYSAVALSATLAACEDPFTPYYVIDRPRVLGVKADTPEFCPLGPDMCKENTFKMETRVSILAADQNGLIADGDYSEEYIKEGYELKWALCSYFMAGPVATEPDCTENKKDLLPFTTPSFNLGVFDILDAVTRTFENMPQSGESGEAGGEDLSEIPENFEYGQIIGFALEGKKDREWGVKTLTLSTKPAKEMNNNPRLEWIRLEGLTVEKGDKPFAIVETGRAYKIEWKFDNWETRKFSTPEGLKDKKEMMHLAFWSTAGSFNNEGSVNIWLADDDENELMWRPPLEVPSEGLEATLFFRLFDYRGGADWVWGKVLVTRGEGITPR